MMFLIIELIWIKWVCKRNSFEEKSHLYAAIIECNGAGGVSVKENIRSSRVARTCIQDFQMLLSRNTGQ